MWADQHMKDATKVPRELAELVVSPKAYASQNKLFAGFRWLRSNNPIGLVEAEGFDPFWVITKHADILEVSRERALFHNGDRATALIPRASDQTVRALTGGSPHLIRTIVHMDAPDHSKYRRVTQAWFTQQKVKTIEERIRITAHYSIEQMAARGASCDFVRDIALHYPLRVIMEILGVPEEDEFLMLRFTQDLFGTENELLGRHSLATIDRDRHAKQLFKVLANFQAYFTQLAKLRQKSPRDDLVSVIANATIDGKPIQTFEATSYFLILATAGHDTVASSLSGAMWALCKNPSEFHKVKFAPHFIPNMVEEAVRWTTPVQHFMRTAIATTELRGRQITKGDWLMLCYLSGNRDEEEFEYPDRFFVDRNFPPNLAFGHGAHACLGQHLARLEMSVFFQELFDRLAQVELAGEPRRSASIFVGGPTTLPIRFKFS